MINCMLLTVVTGALQCSVHSTQTIGKNFCSRYDVAINNNIYLLVIDCSYNYTLWFTLDGNYIGKFSSSEAENGRLNCPSGITVG